MMVLEKSESNREKFVVDTLGNFEPMQRTEVRSDMVVLWDFADNSGKTVLDALETSKLVGGEIEVEGVTVIKLGVYN